MKKFLPSSLRFGVNPNKGFTLVELMVVISIIALLAVIGMAVYGGTQGKARDGKRKADIASIASAFEAKYDALTDIYPDLEGANFTSGTIPKDPKGRDYVIANKGNAFKVCATLENDTSTCVNSTQGSGSGSGIATVATPTPTSASTSTSATSSTVSTPVPAKTTPAPTSAPAPFTPTSAPAPFTPPAPPTSGSTSTYFELLGNFFGSFFK